MTYVGQFLWDKKLACNHVCIVDVMNLCLVFPDDTFVPASYLSFCSRILLFIPSGAERCLPSSIFTSHLLSRTHTNHNFQRYKFLVKRMCPESRFYPCNLRMRVSNFIY